MRKAIGDTSMKKLENRQQRREKMWPWLWLTQIERVHGWVKILSASKALHFEERTKRMKHQRRLDGKCTRPIKKAGMETSKEAETNGEITLILGGELSMDRSEGNHLKPSVIVLNTLRIRRVRAVVNFERFYWDGQEFISVSNSQGDRTLSKQSGKRGNVRRGQRREDSSR